jgi:hypothetical protein
MTEKPSWQDESCDRLVRGEKEFERIENYILQNPVRARAEARCRLKPCPTVYNRVVTRAAE